MRPGSGQGVTHQTGDDGGSIVEVMTTTPAPLKSTPDNSALDRFFATLRRSPLVRSQDRVIAGVCGGIAQRFGISVAVVRVVAVIAALLAPAIVLYLLAWLMLPDSQGGIRLEKALRRGDAPSIALLVVAGLALLPDAGLHSHVGWLAPLVALGVVGVFVWGRSARRGGSNGQGSWPQATSSTTQGQPTDPQDSTQK